MIEVMSEFMTGYCVPYKVAFRQDVHVSPVRNYYTDA
jgi:hypothetical protein